MLPTLRHGDRVLIIHGALPRVGGLVVLRLPGGVIAIKRAVRREPGGWWVERDNPREGTDSWSVGVIPDQDIVGRVLFALPRRFKR